MADATRRARGAGGRRSLDATDNEDDSDNDDDDDIDESGGMLDEGENTADEAVTEAPSE